MSMTGFGRGMVRSEGTVVLCDIRTVNNRFLDLNLRVPRPYMPLENKIREAITARISRGRVDLFLTVEAPTSEMLDPQVDTRLAARYLRQIKKLQKSLGLDDEVETDDLIKLEGVVKVVEKVIDGEGHWALIEKAVGKALDALLRMRKREGQALKKEIAGHLASLERIAGVMESEIPVAMQALKQKTAERIEQVLSAPGLDPDRLAQEVALLHSRSDVTEEIVRLKAHLGQFAQALSEGTQVGKRFDFLLQEMNREVTTYGNKLQGLAISRLLVEAKSEMEKIREQVQNVE